MYTREELESKTETELGKIARSIDKTIRPENYSVQTLIELIVGMQTTGAKRTRTRKKVEAVEAVEAVKEKPVVKKRIIIHNQEGVNSSEYVKVQHNGTMYTIPRDVEVEVPEYVVGVLADAVMTDTKTDRNFRRFPFTVLGDAA